MHGDVLHAVKAGRSAKCFHHQVTLWQLIKATNLTMYVRQTGVWGAVKQQQQQQAQEAQQACRRLDLSSSLPSRGCQTWWRQYACAAISKWAVHQPVAYCSKAGATCTAPPAGSLPSPLHLRLPGLTGITLLSSVTRFVSSHMLSSRACAAARSGSAAG